MELYIIRHAAAQERDAARWPDDAKRPLTDPGRKKFRRVARLLGEVVDDAPVVLSSRWLRAWETAEILSKEADWPAPQEFKPLELQANTHVISALREHVKHKAVALVGHEPQLGELLSLLLSGDERTVRIDLKKGAAAHVTLPHAIAPGNAIMNWIISPRLVAG